MAGLDVWIVDALRKRRIRAISISTRRCDWIERIKPKRAILTNLHTDMDYDELCATLPPGVEPAFDGMSFAIELKLISELDLDH